VYQSARILATRRRPRELIREFNDPNAACEDIQLGYGSRQECRFPRTGAQISQFPIDLHCRLCAIIM